MSLSRYVVFTLILIYCCQLSYAAPAQTGTNYIHHVSPNETLWTIADKYLLDATQAKRLQLLNRIKDPAHLATDTIITIPVRWVIKRPTLVKVKNLYGEADITSESTGKTHALASYAYLFMGDVIYTHAGSTLALEFADGSKLLLAPESELAMSKLGVNSKTGTIDTRVQLRKGRVETQIIPFLRADSRFEISTPSGITSVRGTDFRVNADNANNESRTEVLRGQVNVNNENRNRPISAGYGTITAAGSAPTSPIPLLPPPDLSGLPIVFDKVPIQFEVPALQGAKAYRAQIATNPEFTAVIFDAYYRSTFIRGPSLPDGDYYLRVRGIDVKKLEGYNAQFNFILNATPEAPMLLDPKADAEVAAENPTFTWSKQADAVSYHFQLARDERFTELLVNSENLPDTTLTLTEPVATGMYYWRVAAVSAKEGFGPFSDKQRFRRVLPSIQELQP